MNYTRKRALLACDFCRHRKRRCDGKRPCTTCKDSNADCVYKELPYDRVEDASPTAVIDRLARIENLLEQQSQQIYQLNTRSSPGSYANSQADLAAEYSQQNEYLQSAAAAEIHASVDSSQFLIPKNHATLASTLLSLPAVRDLIGVYPADYFFQVEAKLPLPGILDGLCDRPLVWPRLDPAAFEPLVASYFLRAHPHHPLFSPQVFKSWQTRLLESQGEDNIETCLCFCVYALGTLCASQEGTQKGPELLGLEYFQAALKIMLRESLWGFRPDIKTCQALLLGASYFAHLGRPLHSWRLAQFASRKFLHIIESRNQHGVYAGLDDTEVRTFWQCFMVECDRVAELDVPRSGIEPLGDKMPLPHSTGPGDDENHVYCIAEHAIRRLLNRIHSSLYCPSPEMMQTSYSTGPPDPTHIWRRLSLQKLLSLSSELNRQLEEWYHSIPQYLRPPKGTDALPNDRSRVLRIRYYAARQIIHRPFLLQVVSGFERPGSPSNSPTMVADPYGNPLPIVMEKCKACIDSCIAYLHNAAEMIDKRSPYLWTFSQSCVACLVILWMADSSPSLQQLVPAMQPMQDMVLARLRRWATKDSSFDAEVRILEGLVFSDPMDT
ncbi:hypothetical protein GGR56DRAFT_350395 [Xylariaceae sp. FL0804]|nr:hypothetical protein GGR56DRAFT_350395 [Xylariaceae sp. FL0804]